MVSFIDNSYILVDENLGLKIRDIGSGDVSPKFEHPFHLIRHSKGRIVEYTRAAHGRLSGCYSCFNSANFSISSSYHCVPKTKIISTYKKFLPSLV
jgi:hypothetical protein